MDFLHIWGAQESGSTESTWVGTHLDSSREKIALLLATDGIRTVQNTLSFFDEAQMHLRLAGSQLGVMFMVHPSSQVRDAAQALSEAVSAEGVALSLNRHVYRALSEIDASAEDEATKYYLERTLLSYKLSGVDREDAVRDKVRALADRMTQLSMTFSRTVQDDVRSITVAPESLAGLPEDYLAKHGVRSVRDSEGSTSLQADAAVVLTTDPPDMAPVMSYAADPVLRRSMYLAYNGRGYPANKQVLLDLLAVRQEMAQLLGFRSWAELATVDQMIASPVKMAAFLDDVEQSARAAARSEFMELNDFVETHAAQMLPLTLSDARYWEEQLRRSRYDFDSQSVRPYFPYDQVEQGILAIVAKLFRVRFVPAADAWVWAEGVKALDVFDASHSTSDSEPKLGRIYLDMHPREGKSKWFSECSLVPGVLGKQAPEAALVCNFPKPEGQDAGLMQYSDVVTYFHEFGHLMHEILGGQQRWAGQSGIATEGDFVEVPSQMLEEFFESPDLLRTFAKHYETGEPIPYDVVARMTQAAAHGRALSTLTQVMYATYSLETHHRRTDDLDLDTLLREGYDRFSHYEFVDENRMYAAFTHLVGYTSNYYTYLYDKVIALEFFAEFSHASSSELFDAETAMRYRRQVLEPGGSKPAAELVRDFLGREVSMDALRTWITRGAAHSQPDALAVTV